MTGGLLDRGPSRCDPKRGQRDVADESSAPDSEGMVFEAACGCFENTEEFLFVWTRVWWNRVTPCAVTLQACVP